MPAASPTINRDTFELLPEHDIRNVHGAPGWFELITPDPESAAAVLTRLLGWDLQPLDSSETGMTYFVARLGGYDVGGVRRPMPGEPDGPRWVTYVTVRDVDEIALHADEAGAEVVVPPTQLGQAGRMTVLGSKATARLYAFEYSRRFA
jgi:predicted enzyme related to lactoylglutathione lyase